MKTKICSKCRQEKTWIMFIKESDEFKNICRECYLLTENIKPYIECDICGSITEKRKSDVKRNSKHYYCSKECRYIGFSRFQKGQNNPNYKNANTTVLCSNCKKSIKILKCNLKNSDGKAKQNFYCSQECKAEYQKCSIKGSNNPNYRGGEISFACDNCGVKKSIQRNRFNFNSKYHYCSQACKAEHQKILLKGRNNPNYINGLSYEYRIRYRILEGYNDWISSVYKRDKYTCICCGDDRGGNLNAHHLNGYNWDKENRLNVDNGVCLCADCHKELHKIYGYGNNTLEQFKEFYKNKTGKEFEVAGF